MTKSTQKTLGKVRPPRVQITYDVEVGGAIKAKSLPFVVGVFADLAPNSAQMQMKLKDRNFVEMSNDNFDRVMENIAPCIKMKVENKLDGETHEKFNVELTFKSMDDFSPTAVARSVPRLAKLLDARAKLNDLLAKLEGNERLNDLLVEVVMNDVVKERAYKEAKQLVFDDVTSNLDEEQRGNS